MFYSLFSYTFKFNILVSVLALDRGLSKRMFGFCQKMQTEDLTVFSCYRATQARQAVWK